MGNRVELERLWYTRVNDARSRFDFARNHLKYLQRGCLDGPDGQQTRWMALQAENAALTEYHRVLRIFTALVMDGKVPDEDGWPENR